MTNRLNALRSLGISLAASVALLASANLASASLTLVSQSQANNDRPAATEVANAGPTDVQTDQINQDAETIADGRAEQVQQVQHVAQTATVQPQKVVVLRPVQVVRTTGFFRPVRLFGGRFH